MKPTATELGRVVRSLKGHDKGGVFAVTRVVDESFVLVADGDTRRLAKPKRKRVKHLEALPVTIPVAGKGASGGAIDDSDIRKALRAAINNGCERIDGDRQSVRQEKEECAFVQRGCH